MTTGKVLLVVRGPRLLLRGSSAQLLCNRSRLLDTDRYAGGSDNGQVRDMVCMNHLRAQP